MEEKRCRAEKEDFEFKAMILLTKSDMPSGKAAYHRRRISGFQSVIPTWLLFDDTEELNVRTAQLGGRRRRLSPLQMSTVDQSECGDGWEERWSPLPTTEAAYSGSHEVRNSTDPGEGIDQRDQSGT